VRADGRPGAGLLAAELLTDELQADELLTGELQAD